MSRPFEIQCPACGAWTDGAALECLGCGRPREDENVMARGAGLDDLALLLFAEPRGHG